MARHFLELEHARTLDTDHLLLARRAVRDAASANAMAVVHGEAGLGKTFAVETALHKADRPVLWATFPSKPTPRLIAATLLELLTGRPTRLDRFRAINRLVELLADRDRFVVIDESQLLNGDCIELLRYIHDQPTTRFALVLVGGNGTWRVLSAEPMLASRIFRRVRFQPLRRPEILGQLPGYHPLYETVDPGLIGWIDDVFAHGNLRDWAAFTLSAVALAQETGKPGLDEQITRNVFALHTGGPDR
jgi:AAA domain